MFADIGVDRIRTNVGFTVRAVRYRCACRERRHGNAVTGTIINLDVPRCGNFHGGRCDGQLAIGGDGERHVDVVVGVAELVACQPHRILPDRRAFGDRVAGEAHLRCVVQGAGAREVVARDFLLCSVIDLAVGVTRHSDLHRNFADFLVTVRHSKDHMSEVGVCVDELILCQPHVGRADIRSRCRNFIVHQGRIRCWCECETGVHIVE